MQRSIEKQQLKPHISTSQSLEASFNKGLHQTFAPQLFFLCLGNCRRKASFKPYML
jgi:hypothetical protein